MTSPDPVDDAYARDLAQLLGFAHGTSFACRFDPLWGYFVQHLDTSVGKLILRHP